MNACHLYTVTSLISTLYTALAAVRGLTSDIVYGILSAAVLLIVVVCGSVICALAVKVHRLRKYSKPWTSVA